MASPNTLLNLSGMVDGIDTDETGINAKSVKITIEPEFINPVPNKYGAIRGEVVGPMKLDVALEGEITGSTGVMAAVAGTATTIANSTAYFGAPTTGKYLTKAEITKERENGAPQSVSLEFRAKAGIA